MGSFGKFEKKIDLFNIIWFVFIEFQFLNKKKWLEGRIKKQKKIKTQKTKKVVLTKILNVKKIRCWICCQN